MLFNAHSKRKSLWFITTTLDLATAAVCNGSQGSWFHWTGCDCRLHEFHTTMSWPAPMNETIEHHPSQWAADPALVSTMVEIGSPAVPAAETCTDVQHCFYSEKNQSWTNKCQKTHEKLRGFKIPPNFIGLSLYVLVHTCFDNVERFFVSSFVPSCSFSCNFSLRSGQRGRWVVSPFQQHSHFHHLFVTHPSIPSYMHCRKLSCFWPWGNSEGEAVNGMLGREHTFTCISVQTNCALSHWLVCCFNVSEVECHIKVSPPIGELRGR